MLYEEEIVIYIYMTAPAEIFYISSPPQRLSVESWLADEV
jgi:hypothetical protein